MTAEEIRAEIASLKELRYYEGMGDRIDWKAYRKLTEKIQELENMLVDDEME